MEHLLETWWFSSTYHIIYFQNLENSKKMNENCYFRYFLHFIVRLWDWIWNITKSYFSMQKTHMEQNISKTLKVFLSCLKMTKNDWKWSVFGQFLHFPLNFKDWRWNITLSNFSQVKVKHRIEHLVKIWCFFFTF